MIVKKFSYCWFVDVNVKVKIKSVRIDYEDLLQITK